nr:hypothetical protein [Tatlockia sp.]
MKLGLRLILTYSLLTLASNVLAGSPVRANSLNQATSSQPISSYADFQLYCNEAAYYYKVQSSECEKYYPAKNTSVLAENKLGMD